MRIVFDKNVPVGVRRFLVGHEVRTFEDMNWHPRLENGAVLHEAESAGFDVLITSDQNIRYQQNLSRRRRALVVLGSNIWPIVSKYQNAIADSVAAAAPGSCSFVEMPLPKRQGKD